MKLPHNPCYTDPVANLTLAIDDDLLRRARIRALEEGTSVNAVVRMYLSAYADTASPRIAMQRFLDIAAGSNAGASGGDRSWTREGLHEDRSIS
jgi:plasmid stability protein